MTRALSAASLLAVVLLHGFGCSTKEVYVRTASGAEASVGHFETFGVLLPDPRDLKEHDIEPELLTKLGNLAVEEMKGRGYQAIAAENAQLIVALSPGVREFDGFYRIAPTSKPDVAELDSGMKEGRLTVSFVDVKAKQVVLQRVAQARVSLGIPDARLRDAMNEIFNGVPRSGQ